ncbi:MAG TPA: nucleotidyltransferase [Azoarcus taiwanensis]|nr:nucleotidyltransferase [Azoarcus taiwanensis]
MKTLEYLNSKHTDLMPMASTHNACALSVFDSVTRREDKPNSDIDLQHEFETEASLLNLLCLHESLALRSADAPTS